MKWFLAVLQKYAVFSGRAQRAEYWYFYLVYMLIWIGLAIVDGVMGSVLLSSLFALGLLIPSLAVGARRLHDTGRTGWWLLIALVPLIGAIVLLIFLAQDGEAGENAYGPNPKAA